MCVWICLCTKSFSEFNSDSTHLALNPKALNPKALNPKTLKPAASNPKHKTPAGPAASGGGVKDHVWLPAACVSSLRLVVEGFYNLGPEQIDP